MSKNKSESLRLLFLVQRANLVLQRLPSPHLLRRQLQSPNALSMMCERGWGGKAADSDWSVRPFSPPLLEWHSDVISCHLWTLKCGDSLYIQMIELPHLPLCYILWSQINHFRMLNSAKNSNIQFWRTQTEDAAVPGSNPATPQSPERGPDI
jgi:hypothetical protein